LRQLDFASLVGATRCASCMPHRDLTDSLPRATPFAHEHNQLDCQHAAKKPAFRGLLSSG
jgi:hypothetical protein